MISNSFPEVGVNPLVTLASRVPSRVNALFEVSFPNSFAKVPPSSKASDPLLD